MHNSGLLVVILIGIGSTHVSSASVPSRCLGPISRKDARVCCIKIGLGCIQKGGKCTTTRVNSPVLPCEEGLTCVLSDFGNPGAGEDSKGICMDLEEELKKCTIERCSATGQKTLCKVSGVSASCGAWATRRDSGPRPECPLFCTRLLQIPQPKGSDGVLYGNLRCLIVASCDSDFEIYGPVPRTPDDICKKPIEPLLKNRCCVDYGIECAKVGERCKTSLSGPILGLRECQKALTCVISDFGSENVPPQGTCADLKGKPSSCSTDVCAANGPNHVCKIPNNSTISSCEAWSESLE